MWPPGPHEPIVLYFPDEIYNFSRSGGSPKIHDPMHFFRIRFNPFWIYYNPR